MKMHEFQSEIRHTISGSRVLLVTATYPYGPGESFLAAELEGIAPHLESIEIVPSYQAPGQVRPLRHATINLQYADRRWGDKRKSDVLKSALGGAFRYTWRRDLAHILACPYRIENMKELARALYRARMFETFLRERIAAGGGPDIVYFYWMVPEIMGAIALRNAGGGDFRIVTRAHRTDLYAFERRGRYFGLRASIVEGIDAVYCISGHGQSYLQDRFASLSGKCHLARLGVPEPGFLNRQAGDGELSIVSCSFVSEVKRIGLLIDAIDRLLARASGLRVKWTHIGDGPLYEQVRARAADLLQGRMEIAFTGHLDIGRIMRLYRDTCFDVFINVSRSEGLPVSLMEAASVGLPLIATDVGGSSEIAGPETGILLPSDPDADTVAGALLRFSDKQWAQGLRARSRACWEEKFDARKNHHAFAKALLEMTGRGNR